MKLELDIGYGIKVRKLKKGKCQLSVIEKWEGI